MTTLNRTAATLLAGLTLSPLAEAISYRTVAATGDPAPGSGSVFAQASWATINATGQVSFTASTSGGGTAAWSDASGSLALLARNGDPAPGLPAGTTLRTQGTAIINNNGSTTFYSNLLGSGVSSTNDQAIWTHNGSTQLLLREGDAAPGTPAGATFLVSALQRYSNNGHQALRTRLTGSGVDSSNDYGIWTDSGAGLNLLAREGDPAAGISGANYAFSPTLGGINSSGEATFLAGLAGTVFRVSFTDSSSAIMVASLGSAAQAPLPSSVLLLGLGLLPLLGRQRRLAACRDATTTLQA